MEWEWERWGVDIEEVSECVEGDVCGFIGDGGVVFL